MNGYAIFLNGDGTETKLSWKELKLEENAEKYGYDIYQINNEMVGDCAFYGTTIKEIEIPESVKYVDSDAFYKSEQLEKIIVPKGLDIDLKTKAIIERNNKNYEPLQKFYDNCEKNDIKLLKEEIDGLEQGYFLIGLDENGNIEKRDFNDYADALKLKDKNGERYFTLFQLCDYYIQHQECYPRFNYIEDQIEYKDYTNFKKSNDEIKQIVRFSEGLGIKPNLDSDLTELREQYIEKIETQNKANQAYISKLEKEYNKQKSKETNNVELEKVVERD